MENESVKTVRHSGRTWTDVSYAARLVGLSEAAIYKAIRLEQLGSVDILGVKAVPLDELFGLWEPELVP